jgi:hypothetical protein
MGIQHTRHVRFVVDVVGGIESYDSRGERPHGKSPGLKRCHWRKTGGQVSVGWNHVEVESAHQRRSCHKFFW